MTKTSKEQIKDSWESFKKAWKQLWTAVVSTATGLWNLFKWACQAVDAWDKKIWEKIEKKKQEKWKDTTWKVKKFFRNNIMKLLLWASVLTYWWVEGYQQIKEKWPETIELTIDDQTVSINVSDIFDNRDIMHDLKWSWKEWQEKRYNNYLWNNEAWNTMRGNFWVQERKKVIEWFCRMIESWDINMIFEKADNAWVPRQCIYLALAESGWQAGANSWVAWWYRQFTKWTAKLYWLIDEKWKDYRSDKEKSTEAAMQHLIDNYNMVNNRNKNLKYDITESDKWMFAFYLYNWSPKLVKKWFKACKWKADKYPELQKNQENRNYVSRILWIQDALEKIFKDNDYNIEKVRLAENISPTHVKTSADKMYEDYQAKLWGLTTEQKIEKLKAIKEKYEEEYKANQITKKYRDWAIKVINEEIEELENPDDLEG